MAGPDLIRIVACLCVILIHVSCQGFYSFSDYWKTCVKFDAAARLAVPLFFILSGYFLFTDKPPMALGHFLKRRFSRILLPLLLTFVIYLFVRHWTVADWISRIFRGDVNFHLWFMYALVGLYLTVPLFQHLFTTQEGVRLVGYYVVLWFAAAVVFACVRQYYGWSIDPFGRFNFHYFMGFMGFFFLGGLLRRVKFFVWQRWCSALVCVLATWCIYRFTKSWSLQLGKPDELFFGNLSPFVVLQAVSFFAAVKDVEFQSRVLTFTAEHTYWIYLVHMLAMGVVQKYTGLYVNAHTALNISLITVLTFGLAFAASVPLYWLEKQVVRLLRLHC